MKSLPARRPTLPLLLAGWLALGLSAFGQFNGRELISAGSSSSPALQTTDIVSADIEIWSTDTETHGIFSGNVVVTGTNMKLTCDRLEIIATNIGDKNTTISNVDKFKYLLATGRV